MTPFWIGLTVAEVATIAGVTDASTRAWLGNHGYGVSEGRVVVAQTVLEVEERFYAQRVRADFGRPCGYCGAARSCSHRGAIAA